jgi:AcrR family transcriptional regulator
VLSPVSAPDLDKPAAADEMPPAGEAPLPTRTERRAQKTKRKLLNAALHLFSTNGVDPTSVEEITDHADVGKGTFYRHFSGKEDLLDELLDDSVTRLQKAITTACQGQPGLNAMLDRLFEANLRFFTGNRENLLLLVDGRLLRATGEAEPPKHIGRLVAFMEQLLRPFAPAWVPAPQARLVALSVLSLIVAFVSVGSIGMSPDEMKKGTKSLKRAFVSSCIALLAQDL